MEKLEKENLNFTEKIITLYNSQEYLKLKNFYEKKTIFNILGIEKNETKHSKFIAWILNPNEYHNLKNEPLKKLCGLLVYSKEMVFVNQLNRESNLPEKLKSAFIHKNYDIIDVQIYTEKYNIDILVECVIVTNGEKIPLNIIIENKVNIDEHDKQTIKYYDNISTTKKGEQIIGIFLTPLSSMDLEKLKAIECSSKKYIQINYQQLLDFVLEPLLFQTKSEESHFIIKEYIRNLSKPSINQEQKSKGELIMATSTEEKALLKNFWDTNEDLLIAALKALADDPTSEISVEARNSINTVTESVKRSKQSIQISIEGNIIDGKSNVEKYVNSMRKIIELKGFTIWKEAVDGKSIYFENQPLTKDGKISPNQPIGNGYIKTHIGFTYIIPNLKDVCKELGLDIFAEIIE